MDATEYEKLKDKFISLFEYNKDGILYLDKKGIILDANPAFLALNGCEKTSIVNCHFQQFITNVPGEEEHRVFSLSEQYFLDRRFQLIAKDGSTISCLARVNPIKENESLVGYFLIMKDMRELDKIAERYLESELNYRMIAENIQDVLVLMDRDRNYLYVSPSSKEIFGFDYTNLLDRERFFNIHPDYVDELANKFTAAFEKDEAFDMRLKAFHAERGWIWTEIKGKPVYGKNRQFLHMLLIARDITKEKQQEDHLQYFAYHDMLTGLPNRRMFSDHLDTAISMLSEKKLPFALMLLDVDNFKQINDSYGHEIGDKVIIEFGARLKQIIEERGLVARLGGDEFVILLLDIAGEEDIKNVAQQINEKVREPVIIQYAKLEITASIGGVFFEELPLTTAQALQYADKALYKGKNLGKNTFIIYQKEE
jgi:diguanylate cyclase (GGDEF)-like protein/PAS domain S-box-containing protein